jgi:hypothetical protein
MNRSRTPTQRLTHALRALVLPGLLWPASTAFGQPATDAPAVPRPVGVLAGRPDADPPSELLGKRFESKTAGISFRPPAGCQQSKKPGPESIVEYNNDDQGWLLRVTRPSFPKPFPLIAARDKNGNETQGLLDYTVDQLKLATPGAKFLRQDLINVGPNYVGIIQLRFVLGSQRYLRQQAIVQANEQLYYIFNLTTPAGKIPAAGADTGANDAADPSEKAAVETFNAMVDSIKVLDRTDIKEGQDQRLYRTRSLFLYWTPQKFADVMIPRQYLRVIQNGKDVGYTYYEELPNDPRLTGVDGPGIVVYERSHLQDVDDQKHQRQVDTGVFNYMSFDRRRERWTRSVVLHTIAANGQPDETHTTEFGESSWETKKIYAPKIGVTDQKDPNAPPMRPADVHTLEVSIQSKGGNPEPLQVQLPPFYLPRAAERLLPRLAVDRAFREARTYLFASYIPESHDVRMRYVDVSEEQTVTFNGQQVKAILVSERLGLEGAPTLHYMTPDGQYLGSENKDLKIVIVPTDEATVLKQWPNAKLTRPDQVQRERRAPAAGAIVPGPSTPQDSTPARGLPPAIR